MPALPQDLRQALQLMPTDIESLAGTLKPFVLDRERKGNWFTKPNATLTFDAILDLNLASIDRGDGLRDVLARIRGREVRWAVAAKRDQELRRERQTSLIVLGMHPYESITVIKFKTAVPDLARALGWVAVASPLPNGGQVFRPEHAAAAVLLPEPDTVILVTMIGSDDALLKSVIRRLTEPASSQAFDDAARAWSLTDLKASLWAIRRTKDGKPGRREDRVGRDWAVFAYDQATPQRALFRSIKARWPWRGRVGEARLDQEPVTPGRIGWGGGYVDTWSECAPGTGLQCFAYSFAAEALGIMIWV
jgi:hypothetical protein